MDGSLTLNGIRASATRLFAVLTVVHIPAVAVAAAIGQNAWLSPTAAATAIAAIAALCAWRLKDGALLRCLMAVFVTCGPILVVYAGRGQSGISGAGDWQVDYHMYFFAVFAMLAAYVDWRPIGAAAVLTAGHHLLLDLLVPATLFPQESLDRVVLHGIAVVVECGVLFWLTLALDRLFRRVQEANAREMEENALLRRQLHQLSA